MSDTYKYLRKIRPYKQISNVTRYCNVELDFSPYEIDSLFFWFDSTKATTPNPYKQYLDSRNSEFKETVDIVLIVDDKKLDNTFDKNRTRLRYYMSDYVVKNYYNLLNKRTFKQLVGSYILDWKDNLELINMLKEDQSEKIELNYWINK